MAAALCSCSNEDYLGGHFVTDGAGHKMELTAQISASTTPTLQFAEGDKIAVTTGYVDVSSLNRFYTCQADGKSFTPDTNVPVYIKGNTQIVAYMPIIGNDGGEPAIALNTSDQTDITDYLFAKSEQVGIETSAVTLNFDHAYGQMQLNLVIPDGETIIGYRLSGFIQTADVDPYTLDITLAEASADITGSGTDIKNITFTLIPQTVSDDAVIPASIVLVGKKRSYTVALGTVEIGAGKVTTASVDLTNGVGTVEFASEGGRWSDAGIGGNISSEEK